MLSRTRKHGYSARANIMVALGSVFYFSILVLALYVMDRQVYSAAKLEIIRDKFIEIFQPPDTLNEQARSALFSSSERLRTTERARLKESLDEIVNGPSSMIRMSLLDPDGNVVITAENLSKTTTMNTWDNNLFIREFSGRTSQNVSPRRIESEPAPARVGHLVGTYTSPVGVEEITILTHRYRLYAVALISAWLVIWLLIYEYLLRPVRNVTLHLDNSRRGTPSMIPSARGALERGYNDLAASALLQSIEEKLTAVARPGNQGGSARTAAISDALALAGSSFGSEQLRIQISANSDSSDIPVEHYQWLAPSKETAKDFPAYETTEPTDEVQVTRYPDGTGFHYAAPLADGFMHADCLYRKSRARSREVHENLVRTCDVLRSGFVSFQAYHEHLFRERSEANISLSRNMGHDLTNIIATSKLELMGIKRVLENAGPGTSLSEPKATILQQGVRGLLESTRLMQEMVNIYRSFSYVKRPSYERRPLAPLVEEFLSMFEPALSSQVRIERNLPANIPAPIIEPRLLKLALFNVLQNALDAIKRMPDPQPGTGIITVSVIHNAADDNFEIHIEDNGPGIRDESGRLLSPAEAQVIFDYGFSTKGEAGEGLGLNWVRTIMADFHDGGVRAVNRPEGGAVMILWLRSMERKEARVGAKSLPPGQ